MSFSAWFIPLLITGLFSWGLCSGVDVFDCFLQGAKEGLKTAASITPALVCLLTVVTMFCHSGALDVLTGFLRPVTQLIGFPAEVLPLALLRPVSGSGGTALLHQLLGEYGPDSFIGRVGSVLAAASETTFYAIAVYYGAVGIRRTRHTMAAALTAAGRMIDDLAVDWAARKGSRFLFDEDKYVVALFFVPMVLRQKLPSGRVITEKRVRKSPIL